MISNRPKINEVLNRIYLEVRQMTDVDLRKSFETHQPGEIAEILNYAHSQQK